MTNIGDVLKSPLTVAQKIEQVKNIASTVKVHVSTLENDVETYAKLVNNELHSREEFRAAAGVVLAVLTLISNLFVILKYFDESTGGSKKIKEILDRIKSIDFSDRDFSLELHDINCELEDLRADYKSKAELGFSSGVSGILFGFLSNSNVWIQGISVLLGAVSFYSGFQFNELEKKLDHARTVLKKRVRTILKKRERTAQALEI